MGFEEELRQLIRQEVRAVLQEMFPERRAAADLAGASFRSVRPSPEGCELLSAKDLAELLGFKGQRPEQGVYEMVADGRIPRECVVPISGRRYKFHSVRIQKLIDGGGFVKGSD
jgi:hypothetical protein